MGEPMNPRAPTAAELADIVFAAAYTYGTTASEAGEILESARVAVFDHYVTDCPGYTGPVALVLHSGGPELVDSVTWRNGRATLQQLEPVRYPEPFDPDRSYDEKRDRLGDPDYRPQPEDPQPTEEQA